MAELIQRSQLHSKIWQIANDVRGSVDGWDFKQFVLGALFYRYISENFSQYIEGGDSTIKYSELPDDYPAIEDLKDELIKQKGYFIYPSQLFVNVLKNVDTNGNLNTDLKNIFTSIENSANGYESEKDIKGLFADFDVTSTRLGNTVNEKNKRLSSVLKGVAELDFGNFTDNSIDLFGDAYEFLISNYAANAGKSGGEYFTPQNVSKLLAKLTTLGLDEVRTVYDPACGSGSLLLQVKKLLNDDLVKFYGQEINHTTYNLARMNMFLHNINYSKFDISLGNTLTDPKHRTEKPFDIIVSNPPYSVKWVGNTDPTLINDERYSPAGVLAPNSKGDFAFVMHIINHLSSRGRAAVISFPGVFYRTQNAEKGIRRYLVDNNYIESIISLPDNLFFGTSIAVDVLILSKSKKDNKIQFIDASDFYKKSTNNNELTDENIDSIVKLFSDRKNVEYVSSMRTIEEIRENEYNLSVSSYVEKEDTKEKIDINKVNSEIELVVGRINKMRDDIDKIIKMI